MSKYYRSVLNVLTPAFSSTKSMAFDGVDDFIEATKTAALTTASLSMWVKVSGTFGANERQSLASNDDFNHGRDFIIADTPTTTNDAYIAMFAGAIIYGKTSATGGIPINDGNWHHLVWTYDGSAGTSAAINMYVDGQNQYSNATYSSYWSYEIKFQYFGKPTAANTYFAGSMDEVAYFNSILSASDVTAIYNSGVPGDLSSLTPTAWYRMGENGSWKSTQWLLPENSNKDKVSNYSFEFDGVDDEIRISSPTIYTDFTLSFWYYQINIPGTYETVVGRDTITGGILTSIAFNNGVLSFKNRPGSWTALNTSSASNTEFKHFCITYDSTANELKGYCNGTLEVTTTPVFSGATGNEHSFNRIGSYFNSHRLHGYLDELAVFNTVKNATEVNSLYGGGTPPEITGATNYYRLGEEATFSTNWTVPDSVGSADGISANMTIDDRVGEAPNSSNNSLSYNMDEADRETDVPS